MNSRDDEVFALLADTIRRWVPISEKIDADITPIGNYKTGASVLFVTKEGREMIKSALEAQGIKGL